MNLPLDQINSPSAHAAQAAAVFMKYHGFVRALSVRYAPWPGLVDDISQQVFVEYMQGMERWEPQEDLRPLLATITRRTATRLWEQSMKTRPEKIQKLANQIRAIAESRDDDGGDGRWEEEVSALKECLRRLPQHGRRLLDWYYFQEISTGDIGERLAMRAETVRRAISRLRSKLRECVRGALAGSVPNV